MTPRRIRHALAIAVRLVLVCGLLLSNGAWAQVLDAAVSSAFDAGQTEQPADGSQDRHADHDPAATDHSRACCPDGMLAGDCPESGSPACDSGSCPRTCGNSLPALAGPMPVLAWARPAPGRADDSPQAESHSDLPRLRPPISA